MSKRTKQAGGENSSRRNPPAEHRFKPGQSGNPKGRPKKRKPPIFNPLEQPFRDIAFEELLRPITLSENGVPVTLPAFRAVLRATVLNALKKNSAHAQKTLLHLLLGLEREVQGDHARAFGAALETKAGLQVALGEWLASGKLEQNMPIHPEDIEIDPQTLDVTCRLPLLAEQNEARTQLIASRDDEIVRFHRCVATLAEEGPDDLITMIMEHAKAAVERINEALPPRLRRTIGDGGNGA